MPSQIVTFSLPKLKTLVKSETSCVSLHEACHRTLSLHPFHLENLKASVQELLNSRVTTYDIELQGIILSHKNVKIVDSVALADDARFRLNYYADIYLFKPEIGSTLTGQVSKKSLDHLGVLVHSLFNVAISKGISRSINSYKVGDTVTFKVTKLDFTSRLPYIRGELICDGNSNESTEDIDSGCQSSVEVETKSKKKKKLKIINEREEKESTPFEPIAVPLKSILKSPPPVANFVAPSPVVEKKSKHKNKVENEPLKALNLDGGFTSSFFGGALGGITASDRSSVEKEVPEVYSQDMFAPSPKSKKRKREDEGNEEENKHKRKKDKRDREKEKEASAETTSIVSPNQLKKKKKSKEKGEVTTDDSSTPPHIVKNENQHVNNISSEVVSHEASLSSSATQGTKLPQLSLKKHKRKSKDSELVVVSDESDAKSKVSPSKKSILNDHPVIDLVSKKHKKKSSDNLDNLEHLWKSLLTEEVSNKKSKKKKSKDPNDTSVLIQELLSSALKCSPGM